MKKPTDKRLRNELFVVVTRNDPGWGETETLEREPYSLVIKISDRENADARLYTQIRARLQARART